MLRDARLQHGQRVEPTHWRKEAAPAAKDGEPCLATAIGIIQLVHFCGVMRSNCCVPILGGKVIWRTAVGRVLSTGQVANRALHRYIYIYI